MNEALDVSGVVKNQEPRAIKGILVGPLWTGDRCLSSIDLHFDFLVSPEDETKIGEGHLNLSDGSIGNAIKKVYNKLEAVAKAAGHGPSMPNPGDLEGPEIPDPEWPVRPDVEVIWEAAKTAVGDGTGAAPTFIATFIAKKNWGQYMLQREWAKVAVADDE